MKNMKKAFTLVELIVVITILAILATIWFMSFQSYMWDARDANRTTSIDELRKWLSLYEVKKSKYPEPDSAITITNWTATWVILKQWTIWKNISDLIKMTSKVEDPLTKKEYVYSVSNNWKYYQIWADLENTISYNTLVNTTYAEWNKAYVKWNYSFDPSLPSLITISWSINTSSWIFDPNVCFVIDWWTNLISSTNTNCLKKKNMSLKDYDSSLVWYWNFDETWFIPDVNQYWWTNFYKDYSWNWHTAFNSWSIQWIWFVQPTQNLGYIWKWIYFTSGSLILWSDLDYNFWNDLTFSVITNLYSFKNPYPRILHNRYFIFHYNWCEYYPIVSDCPTQLINNLSIKSIWWVITNSSWWYITDMSVRTWYFQNNLNNFVILTYVFSNDTVKRFINWTNVSTFKKEWFNWINKIITGTINTSAITLWGILWDRTRDFNWIIDDIKIYNRALSDEEIAQQAKIAWF